jgi:CRP/FNR family transcriptional regulator, cyclic AMP receptor protein
METLRLIRLFRHLPDTALASIGAMVRVRRVEKGEVLSLDDQLAQRMCFVCSGRYRLGIITPSGTPIAVHQVEPGDHFGELWIYSEARRGTYQLIADTSGVLLQMQVRDVMRLAVTVPEFSRGLMRSMANMAAGYAARIYEFASLDASGRLRAELLRLAQPGGVKDRIMIDPAPTHAAIASQIGSTREGVTRNLRRLAMKGLIRTERGRIEVLSLSRLRQEVERDLGG